MADIAASVLAQLKNKAAESDGSYQLFCQGEFLRRLEKSKYAENLVLKGGLFLHSLTDFDSRVTVDVDFLLRQIPNTPEQLKSILEDIIVAHIKNTRIPFRIDFGVGDVSFRNRKSAKYHSFTLEQFKQPRSGYL